MRFLWLEIFFKKFCFLTNKYGRPASAETTSLVINAMPILLVLIKYLSATRFESRAIIEAEAEYFTGLFHKYFAYCRYESSYFVHILCINAYW